MDRFERKRQQTFFEENRKIDAYELERDFYPHRIEIKILYCLSLPAFYEGEFKGLRSKMISMQITKSITCTFVYHMN